jgi:hypothetical protein
MAAEKKPASARAAKGAKDAKAGAERRKHARVAAGFPCVLVGADRHEQRFELLDLSESGVRMRCGKSLAPMTRIQVAMELPAGRLGRTAGVRVTTDGVVVWSHKASQGGFDTGVFFPDLSNEQRGLLAAFVLSAVS